MRNIRKMIGLFLAFAMFWQVFPAFAEDTGAENTEKYIQNIQLLVRLGFCDVKDEAVSGENKVTRADFSTLLVKMMNMDIALSGGEAFADVPASHSAASAIEILSQLGILNGSEGLFRPGDEITYAEAVAAFVKALGYGQLAQYSGGYPSGYFSVANEKGMLKGLKIAQSETVTLGQLALLSSNFLETDLFQVIRVGSDGSVSRQEVKGQNVLSQYHGIYTLKDVVNGNEHTLLNKPEGLPQGYVKVGNLLLKANGTDIGERLGYKVKVYYNQAEETVVCYQELEDNRAVTVTSAQMVGYENGSLLYENNDKDYKLKISPAANIIYNGKAIEEFDKGLYQIKDGTVTCIENNDSGSYNIVIITDYETFIVDKISTDNEVIQLKYNASPISVRDIDDCIIYDQDGRKIDVSYLLEWNVLSVLQSKDGKLCRIYRSNSKKVGAIHEIFLDSKEGYITLDTGDRFAITKDFTDRYPALKTGSFGVFLLNTNGKAAGYKPKNGSESGYAYLLGMMKEDTFSDFLNVKLFTDQDEMRIVKTGEKITVDGTRDKTLSAVSGFFDSERNALKERQMIRYEINENGVLTTIDTVARNGGEDSANTLTQLTKTVGRDEVKDFSMKYYLSTTQFDGEVFLSSDCKVFMLPEGDIAAAADDDFSIVKPSALTNGQTYSFTAYKLTDSELEASAIMLQGTAANSFGTYEVCSLIEKIVTAVNEKGDIVHKVTYWYQGVKRTAFTKDGELFADITPGDVMFLGKNAKGEISYFDLLFDYSEQKNIKGDPAPAYGAGRDYVYGYICSVYKNVYTVTKEDPAAIPPENLAAEEKGHRLAKSMYVFDDTKGDNKVRLGNYGDLMGYKQNPKEYYKVFIFQLYAYDYDAVIYKCTD
ncbi:S-layer homology domain-containing protein [Acetivibrio sp. MSJd-27]|uniref:S-layer homology domain-containing protein n=1 Tax=Acetivibrio sp. MSJd-27 TaxID=2841523 RepID=UPI001C10D62A|nr:S-layer homology domain-containing protein [Acetivibrio sp. MSJd-27]MBU5449797.1 S-layer homology domain-containing protein [Acetivibrio sp. MSJd-27]